MIQFYLSKAAVGDFKHLLEEPTPINYQAMQWYLHKVTIARRKCVIAMEKRSRYVITFCGLTKKEFAGFPQLFSYWFSLHALASVVEQQGQDELLEQQAIELAASISSGQTYQLGFDRSVTAHINQAIELLRYYVEERGYPLPVEPREAAIFSTRANETARKSADFPDYFLPVTEFSKFWLGLLNYKPLPAVGAVLVDSTRKNYGANVIHVDFSKRKLP
ncbi:MAG TPA: hypothetical protein VIZ65_00985 [Cellvibrionaceae bacterium]